MRILGKIIKFLGNFIGVILSLVLSLVLLVMLFVTPMLSGLTAFTRPETISQVVQEIDFAAIFLESFQGEMSEEQQKEMEFIVGLTETQAFDDLVNLYATDITNAFEETPKPSVLTKEALRKIAKDNMGELIQIVRKMGEDMGEDVSSYTDAELEELVWGSFEEMADRFLELAPTVEDLRKLMGRISNEISTNSSSNERPNSNNRVEEESYDTPVYDNEGDESGYEGGTITYIPGDGNSVTTVVVGPNGEVQPGGEYSYYVDPETGEVVIVGGVSGGTASGGTITFGKAIATNNGTIRILLMGIAPSGGEEQHQEEIADVVLKLATMAKNGTLTLMFVGVIVVLALLICLLRWPRFKGFMWVAVMLLIGAAFVALAGVAYTALPGMVAGQGGQGASAISAAKPIIKVITNSMFIAAGIYAVVAIVLIVLFVVFRKALRKQKAAKAAAVAREEAVEEIAEEAETAAIEAPVDVVDNTPTEAEIPEESVEIPAEEADIPTEEAQEPTEEEIPAE